MLGGLSLLALFDELDGIAQLHRHRVDVVRNRHVLLVVEHVWTKATCADAHRSAFVATQFARQLEEFEGFLQCDGLKALSLTQLGKARLFLISGRTNLHHRTEATNLHAHFLSALWVDTQHAFSCLVLIALVEHLLALRFEFLVELLHGLLPVLLAFGYLVEVLLHVGREVVVHDILEVGNEEVVHHCSCIRWKELTLLIAHYFALLALLDVLASLQREQLVGTLLTLLVALLHVFALLDGGDGWRVSRRTTNAQFFQLLHKRSLCIAKRTLREAFRSLDFLIV